MKVKLRHSSQRRNRSRANRIVFISWQTLYYRANENNVSIKAATREGHVTWKPISVQPWNLFFCSERLPVCSVFFCLSAPLLSLCAVDTVVPIPPVVSGQGRGHLFPPPYSNGRWMEFVPLKWIIMIILLNKNNIDGNNNSSGMDSKMTN